ncbi:MAG: homocysteine S-methyltransferase family protein [Eubacteriales bacterium]
MNVVSAFPLPFLLDGATGTELLARGMKSGECTEAFVLAHPEVMRGLQTEYFRAGSDAVLAPTFGANLPTLVRHGFDPAEADSLCRRLVDLSRSAANEMPPDKKCRIGGDVSPTGLIPQPFGDTPADEILAIFKRQIRALVSAGVDFLMLETMISLAELRLATLAAREVSAEIPIFTTMTVDPNGRTMNGDSLDAALLVLSQYNIQGFGVNCSIGPDVVYHALEPVAPLAKKLGIPLIAKPNAGLPIEDEHGSHFSVTPDDMAAYVEKFTGIGAYILGGCCGTSPAYIAAMRQALDKVQLPAPDASDTSTDGGRFVATARTIAKVDEDAEYVRITADDEDTLYDLSDDADPEDVLYLELGPGAADLLLSMDAFLQNPLCVRGEPSEIERAERYLCRKIR